MRNLKFPDVKVGLHLQAVGIPTIFSTCDEEYISHTIKVPTDVVVIYEDEIKEDGMTCMYAFAEGGEPEAISICFFENDCLEKTDDPLPGWVEKELEFYLP